MRSLLLKFYKALKLPKGIQLKVMRLLEDKFLVGVTGIIFNEKNEILLFKHSYRAHSWSLPGGYLKASEHPSEGLEREIEEESGLVVSIDFPLKTRTDREAARLDICYVGVYIGGVFVPSQEVTEYGFFAQDKMPLLRSNQVILVDEALKRKSSLYHD
jgi:ADP-ribose pyrophosphatase YjhB (NUDIX family)